MGLQEIEEYLWFMIAGQVPWSGIILLIWGIVCSQKRVWSWEVSGWDSRDGNNWSALSKFSSNQPSSFLGIQETPSGGVVLVVVFLVDEIITAPVIPHPSAQFFYLLHWQLSDKWTVKTG